jgi:hypothetical protein
MKVLVEAVRGVSIIYAMTVGNVDARESNKILPLALQTKTSICPGVSTNMFLIALESRFCGIRSRALFEEIQNLVYFCGEEVERGENAAVGAEIVGFHYFFVVD